MVLPLARTTGNRACGPLTLTGIICAGLDNTGAALAGRQPLRTAGAAGLAGLAKGEGLRAGGSVCCGATATGDAMPRVPACSEELNRSVACGEALRTRPASRGRTVLGLPGA